MSEPTNDEINRAIAETLGLEPWIGQQTGIEWWRNSEGASYRLDVHYNFATDLNAAVGLLEEAEKWSVFKDEWGFIASINYGKGVPADTPARAICVAYLKSKGVEM